MAQASAATFSTTPLGHKFVLRAPLAKATANRCADCGEDIRGHARGEVTDVQLLAVLNAQDDGAPTMIVPGELAVGSYKAALAVCKDSGPGAAVLNCAGRQLHDFLPTTRAHFDKLRNESPPRMLDLEWEDSEDFEIRWEDIAGALSWMRTQVGSGLAVVVTCAQGKSRSGTMATAYLVAKMKLPVVEALALVKARRPLVDPNPAFMRALRTFEVELLQQPAPMPREEVRLREAFAKYDVRQQGGLNVQELRVALIQSGEAANAAKPMMDEFAAGDELTADEFVRAWLGSSLGPIC